MAWFANKKLLDKNLSGKKLSGKKTLIGGMAGLLVWCLTGQAAAQMLPVDELVKTLQQGGYIIYIRHAATDHSERDSDLSDLRRCDLQRNLSVEGKQEAKMVGDAIKKLNIPVDKVYTSPYCRCVDTAKIAFERYEIDNDMRATFATDLAETEMLVAHLKQQLNTAPKSGFNTVLVGHTANLREVTNIWPKPEGVAHIFKPIAGGGYEHMGRIDPAQWGAYLQ